MSLSVSLCRITLRRRQRHETAHNLSPLPLLTAHEAACHQISYYISQPLNCSTWRKRVHQRSGNSSRTKVHAPALLLRLVAFRVKLRKSWWVHELWPRLPDLNTHGDFKVFSVSPQPTGCGSHARGCRPAGRDSWLQQLQSHQLRHGLQKPCEDTGCGRHTAWMLLHTGTLPQVGLTCR